MRSLYFALLIGVILCTVTVGGALYMSDISDNMVKMAEDFTQGGIETLESYWNKNKNRLMALTNHKNCDEISNSISRIKMYLAGGEQYYFDALAELEVLKELCGDISEYEKLKYFNIF